MRQLDRNSALPPVCLTCYQHGKHNWGSVSSEHKDEIRASLERMQGRRCAYCEGPVDTLGHHIEHFRAKGAFPKLTFDWSNLYWSCDASDSCGRHKDHGSGPYDPDDLIDPCREDPDRFFKFRSDGTIRVRTDIPDKEQRRANETLRVFNLNPSQGRLRQMRKRALESYTARDPDILAALETFEPSERDAIIADELARTASEPFSAVIRHFFAQIA